MNLISQDGFLSYFPNFMSMDEAHILMACLQENIKWRSDKIKMFGREVDQPRLTAWYGDPAAVYTYSGLTMQPMPWTPDLLELKVKVESMTNSTFNSVLLNLYRNGRDHMSYHCDDEQELGSQPTIVSVSLGEQRIFQLKHRYLKDLKPVKLVLGSGSLMVMAGELQKFWLHRINPTKRAIGPRINLTFRKIIF
jgi:alkylated DNA repair dioxygenase AlkB